MKPIRVMVDNKWIINQLLNSQRIQLSTIIPSTFKLGTIIFENVLKMAK